MVLVSGGTSGLGAAIARAAVREGARVVVTGRRREPGEALVAELEAGRERGGRRRAGRRRTGWRRGRWRRGGRRRGGRSQEGRGQGAVKKIWWDIRPHPFFSTIEVRICDIPLRAEETLAIAALIQATAVKLYNLHERNQDFRQYSRALLMENKWRAVRYGLDGKLIDFGKQQEVPERELILEYLELVDDVVDGLDSRAEIDYIRHMLETGTGADRQLRVFEQTGDLKAVVDYMVEETAVGIF